MSAVDIKKHGKITCIPKTTEQYTAFTIGSAVFKDSYAFMSQSLSTLVNTLSTSELTNTKSYIEKMTAHPDSYLFEPLQPAADPPVQPRKRKQSSVLKKGKRPRCEFLADEDDESDRESVDECSSDSDSEDDTIIDDHSDINDDPSLYHQVDMGIEKGTSDKSKTSVYYRVVDLPDGDYRECPPYTFLSV
jgi:hypothetical protein